MLRVTPLRELGDTMREKESEQRMHWPQVASAMHDILLSMDDGKEAWLAALNRQHMGSPFFHNSALVSR